MPFKMKFLMEGEGAAAGGGASSISMPPATTQVVPPGGDGAPAPQRQQQGGGQRGDKVVPMARSTLAKITREHQDKGRQAALSELEQRARNAGYKSVDDMLAAAERAKKNGGSRSDDRRGKQQQRGGDSKGNGKQQRQAQQTDDRPAKRDDRKMREYQARLDRERRDRIAAQRKAEEKEREAWAAEATGQLKVMALEVGGKDPDYMVSLWARECEAQSSRMNEGEYQKWLDSVDEREWFSGLRKTRPHLFQEVVVPANTGTTTGGNAPPAPGAGQVVQAGAAAGQKTAKKMTDEEYRAELKRRGLRAPSL